MGMAFPLSSFWSGGPTTTGATMGNGLLGHDPPGGLESVDAWQTDVHCNDIGREIFECPQRIFGRGGRRADLKPGVAPDNVFEQRANHGRILDNHYPNLFHIICRIAFSNSV